MMACTGRLLPQGGTHFRGLGIWNCTERISVYLITWHVRDTLISRISQYKKKAKLDEGSEHKMTRKLLIGDSHYVHNQERISL